MNPLVRSRIFSQDWPRMVHARDRGADGWIAAPLTEGWPGKIPRTPVHRADKHVAIVDSDGEAGKSRSKLHTLVMCPERSIWALLKFIGCWALVLRQVAQAGKATRHQAQGTAYPQDRAVNPLRSRASNCTSKSSLLVIFGSLTSGGGHASCQQSQQSQSGIQIRTEIINALRLHTPCSVHVRLAPFTQSVLLQATSRRSCAVRKSPNRQGYCASDCG
jgi:hypothetical protein